MLAILVIAICLAPLLALWHTTRRRPLVVRETPVCSHLPRDIGVPTIRRRGK